MDSKQVEVVSRKMALNQVMLDYVPVCVLGGSGSKNDSSLVVTTASFFLLSNNNIKKQIAISEIKSVTVSIYSQELVLHCLEEDVRISSNQGAKLLGNILKVREKVLKEKALFPVLLENEKSLSKYVGDGKKGFWSSLFSKEDDRKSRGSDRSRKSLCRLQVSDKTYLSEISRAVYAYHYSSIRLLYINGAYNFFFDEFDYNKEELDPNNFRFTHKETKQTFLMRKIAKESQEANHTLRKYLEHFKLNNYKEEILYAVESDRYFEVITPHFPSQTDLEAVLNNQHVLPEIDLVSIFYSLMALIDGQLNVLHSLRPKHVVVRDGNIIIISQLCLNRALTTAAYLAPQELNPDMAPKLDPQLINFWKIGILLYEMAYLIQPFPIEYLAEVVARNKTLKLTFPASTRSAEIKHFLCEILQIDVERRGSPGWRQRIFDHKWLKQSMR